ncbi:TetR/AcrR family transcriptional regulator [Micromonospora sp. U21]|uniref:TetR/AcrR family transcriptional regulator n=1 Tax=Micromonospora sp. U21 TaxID=2824899 RepID=UPI001B39AFA9|nr:TetR/AcrR family transcriptional regulator [Micromonospora sp. U21]MBQ0902555.1 TetR/AcrR family transcriptional regulator [Micromonospora sp. U21]
MARPRQFDEEQVLRAVRDQFWDAGYAATSLEDLMRVSGLGKGSLYGAFGDKRQLFLRALRSYNETSCGYLQEMFSSTPRVLDALRAFLAAPVSDPGGAAARRGCLMANSTYELATTDPDVLTEARRTYETTTGLVAECVARAQDEGDMPRDADPIETARALLVAQQGLVFMGRTGLDIDKLTVTARTLTAQLLPGA